MSDILYIEDEKFSAAIVSGILQQNGHNIVTFHEGAAALDWVAAGHPLDLVITDLFLPNRDGLEIITAVRKLRKGVGILAMSANPPLDGFGETALDAAARAGAHVILQKPVTREALLDGVARVLEARPAA